MVPYPDIDPTIIRIGPVQLRWYGLMYLLGFMASYVLIKRQRRARRLGLQGNTLQNLIFYVAVGLILGARLGYLLFYQYAHLGYYLKHPLEVIAIWHGGMSFHGGLLGAVLAGIWFCRRHRLPFWDVADTVIVTAPIGLALGRIGNFINGELYGRPSTAPWAMVFPTADGVPRHPSQLYEAGLEGVLLFVILWSIKDRSMRPGFLVCLFIGGYGSLRFFAEFFRQPDPHIGLLWGMFSMGQLLCLAMVLLACLLWFFLPARRS
jgi:phosphatidylglycerol:prolipoprotein diacylglycerol transferase